MLPMRYLALMTAFLLPDTWPPARAEDSSPAHIEVFTTSDRPVLNGANLPVTAYHLDGLEQLERMLSLNLPHDQDQARAIALQRIGALRDELQDDVARTVQGLSLAKAYGLRKLPAMVFDHGRAVIYGVDHVDQALALYREGT